MESSRARQNIINLISESLGNLSKQDLIAISNFCASLSNINWEDKKSDLTVNRLIHFYLGPDPIPAPIGEGAVRLFNIQSFSYLQKVFVIPPDVVDFLLKENSDTINIFLLEREINKIPCLDIAYEDTSTGKFYYTNRLKSGNGEEMQDFNKQKQLFEANIKLMLDINRNPKGNKCPAKVMIEKADLQRFIQFKDGRNNPQVHLITGINQDVGQDEYYNRVTLVMNFVYEDQGVFYSDMDNYYDTYHLCPPGTC